MTANQGVLNCFLPGQISTMRTFVIIHFKVASFGPALAWVGLGVRGVGEEYDLNREHFVRIQQRTLF